MKNALLSPTVRSVNMKNFLTENVRPHFIYSIEIQPHYSQSSRENAATSSGTYPLASYKEVPPLDMKTGHEKVLDELSEKQLEMWQETREA